MKVGHNSRRGRRFLLLVSAIVAIGVAAAAAAVTAGRSSASSQAAAASGELTIATTTSLDNLDPLTNAGDPYRNSVRLTMFDTLVAYDAHSTLEPSLAASWKTQQKGKVYVFSLRKNVTWHDGKPLTAADVVYTFKRVANKKVGVYFADLLSNVASATAANDQTVKVTLKKPSAGFLDSLINMSIVQNGSGNSNRTHPVGTGPFMFKSFTPNQQLVLAPNPHYFGGAPKLSQLTFIPVSSSQVAFQNLQAGSVNVVTDLAPTLYKTASKASRVKAHSVPSTTMAYIDFFSKNMPSKDPRIRQAMMMCLNESAVNTIAYQGIGTVNQNIIPPGSSFYSPVVKTYPYDPTAAKKLLAAAGFPNGFKITIDGLQGFDSLNKIVTIWQAGLKACGIDAKVRVQEFNAWLNAFFKHTLQVSIDTDSQGIDPNRFYNISFVGPHAGGGDAVSPELLKVGAEADAALNPSARKRLYAKYAILAHKDLHAAPVYRTPTLYATNANVHGITVNLDAFYDFSHATVG
jgi:peptide/nickel transport system substrate-binding protein